MVLDDDQYRVEWSANLIANKLFFDWMRSNGRTIRTAKILRSCNEPALADALENTVPDQRFEKLVNDAAEKGEFKDLPNYPPFYIQKSIHDMYLGYQTGLGVAADFLKSNEQCEKAIAFAKFEIERASHK